MADAFQKHMAAAFDNGTARSVRGGSLTKIVCNVQIRKLTFLLVVVLVASLSMTGGRANSSDSSKDESVIMAEISQQNIWRDGMEVLNY